jgi:hypothetical protein
MLAEELGYREEEQDLSSHASEAPSSLGSVSKWTKRTQDDNTPTYAALFFLRSMNYLYSLSALAI